MNVFENYSKYYDMLYQDKAYGKEVSYITESIIKYKPSTKTLLEFGCGTGIHAGLLAQKGYKITGIDQSSDMIKAAKIRSNKLPTSINRLMNFHVGDIRKRKKLGLFDACIALFHIVSYLPKNEDVAATFSNARKNLTKGGLFIFDCWYGPAVLDIAPSVKAKIVENDDIKVIRIATPETRPNDCIVDVNYHLLIKDKNNNNCDEVQEKHEMRYFFKPELEFFLSVAGFELLHTEEWLTKKPAGPNTWGVTFISRAV